MVITYCSLDIGGFDYFGMIINIKLISNSS